MKTNNELSLTHADIVEHCQKEGLGGKLIDNPHNIDDCTPEYFRRAWNMAGCVGKPSAIVNHARKCERKAALDYGIPNFLCDIIALNRHGELENAESRGAAAYLAACEEADIEPVFSGKQEAQPIKAKPTSSSENAERKLLDGIRALMGQQQEIDIDEARIREIAREETQAAASAPIQFVLKGSPPSAAIEGAHKVLPDLVEKLYVHGRALLSGPTGTGKSRAFYDAAKALSYEEHEIRLISCTAETSIYDLLGARDADGKYWEGPLLQAFERGGIILIDEYDALDPSVQVSLNAVLDSMGRCPVPLRDSKPIARRHERFMPVLSMNSMNGATHEYTGRGGKPDAAAMARFPWITRLHVDYDRELEARILSSNKELAENLWKLRDAGRAQAWDQEYIPTTRDFESLERASHEKTAKAMIQQHISMWPAEMQSKAKEALKHPPAF